MKKMHLKIDYFFEKMTKIQNNSRAVGLGRPVEPRLFVTLGPYEVRDLKTLKTVWLLVIFSRRIMY